MGFLLELAGERRPFYFQQVGREEFEGYRPVRLLIMRPPDSGKGPLALAYLFL